MHDHPERRRSGLWFLLPIFFSAVGGVIAYFVIRRDDPAKARNCLYLGLALTAVGLVMNALLAHTLPDAAPGFVPNV